MYMRISFESKGDFDNVRAWLKRVSDNKPSMAMSQLAHQGESSLSANTPKDTGETAAGWKSKVVNNGNVSEVVWYNTAHPEAGVNLARLIELGHGTGTGGYVAPRPYIKQAMTPVWRNTDRLIKELIK